MGRPILSYALPIAAAQVLQLGAAAATLAVLGHLGTDALGAAAAPIALMAAASALFAAFASGAMIAIARAHAANDRVRLHRLIAQSLTFAFLIGIVAAAAGALLAPMLLHAFNVPLALLGVAVPYAQLLAISLPGLFLYTMYAASLEALGQWTSALLMSAGLTAIYLLGLSMLRFGILAVPTAWVAAALIVGIGTAIALYTRHSEFRFELSAAEFIPDLKSLASVLRFDASVSAQCIAVALADVAILSNAYDYGARGAAAYAIVLLSIAFVTAPSTIFATAAAASPRAVRTSFGFYAVSGGAIAIAVYLFAPALLRTLAIDPLTAAAARQGIFTVAWSAFALGAANIVSGELAAYDEGIWPAIVAIAGVWLVLVPFARIFASRWGLDGIWYAYTLSYAAIAAVQMSIAPILLRRPRREREQVAAAQDRTII